MLIDHTQFFDRARKGKLLGPTLTQDEVDGCNAILTALDALPIPFVAYGLATAYHETAHTMRPVEEANWLSLDARNKYFFRMYDRKGNRPLIAAQLGNTQDGDGIKYHGRGYVQITGRKNYALASTHLGVDFLANPDLVLRDDYAAMIMRFGMTEGWFVPGRTLSRFLTTKVGTQGQFIQCRTIINGVDDATAIALEALEFQGYML